MQIDQPSPRPPIANPRLRRSSLATAWLLALLGATVSQTGCGGDDDTAAAGPVEPEPEADPAGVVASCEYDQPFAASGRECREYVGDGWGDLESARDDCLGQVNSEFTPGEPCSAAAVLGWCYLGEDGPEVYRLVFEGDDPMECTTYAEACDVFVGGRFEPAELCEAEVEPQDEPGMPSVFIQPTLECSAPRPGEPPPAQGDEVCTQQWIGGCTEEGRRFDDYASCDVVYEQRGYVPVPPSTEFTTPADDPRWTDAVYQEELAWVTEQVDACGCVCCHSERTAPEGPSNWYIEAEGIWTDSIASSGLAMLGGWRRSELLGVYPAEENNGFSRFPTGLPTTDTARLQAFFQGELERRGQAPEDWVGDGNLPFMVAQYEYLPSACENGEGVRSDGTIAWVGGDARYLYVLDPGTVGPLGPPNLDEPAGTRWLLEVPWTEAPLESGFDVHAPPARASQRIPAGGSFPTLTPGATYGLYAYRDVLQPITRCTFVYE